MVEVYGGSSTRWVKVSSLPVASSGGSSGGLEVLLLRCLKGSVGAVSRLILGGEWAGLLTMVQLTPTGTLYECWCLSMVPGRLVLLCVLEGGGER